MECQQCKECVYIGDGDFYCMKTKAIVMTDFTPTDDYMCCKK